jgi:NAD(P)-dependent dehydrogenase (short-subunit alcohol dehydrogenase family)
MDGINVVVIGGTSGIGLATAISSAQRGATVFAAGRSLDKIEACQASYPDIQFRQVDTHDPEGLSALFSEAGPIHHLVGAATGATRTNGPFMSQTDEQFRAAFDKFWGYTHVVRQGVPHLVEDASITLVSGTPARKCNPGMISVSCTGCAVEGFVRALTPELAPIRINGVAPGIIDTPMFDHFGEKKAATLDAIGANFPLGRVGQPEEVAEAILLCMSNTYMTGVVIDVDGGALLP